MSKITALTIENFRSFYSPQTLNLSSDTAFTAIFGPNAGGKTNIARSFGAMFDCIYNSAGANFALPYQPFLLRLGADTKDTKFSLRFTNNNCEYQYSYSYNAVRISSELLRERKGDDAKFTTIFNRDSDVKVNPTAERFGFGRKLLRQTRKDTLLITKARESNNKYANIVFEMMNWFILFQEEPLAMHPTAIQLLKGSPSARQRAIEFLQASDFAIRSLTVEDAVIPDELFSLLPIPKSIRKEALNFTTTTTTHVVRNDELEVVGERTFDLETQESAGTREIVGLVMPILEALDNGRTIYLDEFSAYMHPDLAAYIIKLFKSKNNKHGARLIVNTHNTSVIDQCDLTREEIILVEKSFAEESVVTPLAAKSVRKDEPFEKRYRAGLYGAVPMLREMHNDKVAT